MKVLLPKVNRDTTTFEWKSTDVRFCNYLTLPQKNNTIENMYRAGVNENILFFYNKPPKWNECKFYIIS